MGVFLGERVYLYHKILAMAIIQTAMQQDDKIHYQSGHVTLAENGFWLLNYTYIT